MPYTELYKGRYSHPDYCYHITTVTHGRRAVFTDLTAGQVVVHELMALHTDEWAQTLCFMIMPDHLHWLMQLGNKNLGQVMQRLKGRTSRQLGGALWQERYYDHAVRGEEYVRVLARYIVANPLRSGLVNKLGDYPLWDAAWL